MSEMVVFWKRGRCSGGEANVQTPYSIGVLPPNRVVASREESGGNGTELSRIAGRDSSEYVIFAWTADWETALSLCLWSDMAELHCS